MVRFKFWLQIRNQKKILHFSFSHLHIQNIDLKGSFGHFCVFATRAAFGCFRFSDLKIDATDELAAANLIKGTRFRPQIAHITPQTDPQHCLHPICGTCYLLFTNSTCFPAYSCAYVNVYMRSNFTNKRYGPLRTSNCIQGYVESSRQHPRVLCCPIPPLGAPQTRVFKELFACHTQIHFAPLFQPLPPLQKLPKKITLPFLAALFPPALFVFGLNS